MQIHATLADIILIGVECTLKQPARVDSLAYRLVVEVIEVDHTLAALLRQIVHVTFGVVLSQLACD